ncbi:MAG: YhjD/YihY/BrkB family envelope integrity protein [Myxococcota bacterium]
MADDPDNEGEPAQGSGSTPSVEHEVLAPSTDEDPSPLPSSSVKARRIAAVRRRLAVARTRLVPKLPEAEPAPLRRIWLLLVFVLRRWLVEDRCSHMAGLLTMHTLLSTVPTIGVALLIVGLMDPSSGTALLEEMFRGLVPETDKAIVMAEDAMKLAARVNVSTLGAWGFGVTLSIAFVLFSTLERTFNGIWRVTRSRSVLVKFTMFYTLATLGPALMLYSLTEPLVAGVTRSLSLPMLTTGAGLVLLNRYVPYTAVRWGPAVAGGLLTAVLIEAGKVAFGYYATSFALRTYEGVYGSLAIFPIIIVWSYLSWMVILLGAEITFVIQRRRYIALQGYVNSYVRERTEAPNDSGRTAARLMLAICDSFARRGIGLSPETLGERFRLPLERIGELLTHLERHGYIVDTDTDDEGQRFVPARPLAQIMLLDVLVLFDHEQSQQPRADRLGEVFARLDDARLHIVEETSYADLVTGGRRP